MTQKEFQMMFDRRTRISRETLVTKAKEYASDKDRMHNFQRASAILGETPEKALVGMAIKHLVSVLDLVDGLDKKIPDVCVIDEKIGDLQNYIFLLDAMLMERYINFSSMVKQFEPIIGEVE